MVYYARLIAECTNDEEDNVSISLIVEFEDEDHFETLESEGFDSLTESFNSALSKKHSGYYVCGLIEVEEFLSKNNDTDFEDEDEENEDDDEIVPDFAA